MKNILTEWALITGAPSSGKTSIIKNLQETGHLIKPEPVQICIETRLAMGETLEQICNPSA